MVIALSVGLVLLLSSGERAFKPSHMHALVLMGVAFVLNLVYLGLSLKKNLRTGWFIILQFCLDGLIETFLIYFTGGAASVFLFLYFASVVGATFLISSRGGVFLASLNTTLLAAVTLLYYFASAYSLDLPLWGREFISIYPHRIKNIVAFLVAEAVGLHMVAFLGSMLIKSLSRYKILYEEILRHMGEGLIALDETKRIVFINDKAKEMLHYKGLESLVGNRFSEVFRRKEEKNIHAIFNTPEEVDIEFQVNLRSGDKKTINVKTSVIRSPRGKVRGVVGIFTDLTVKKRIQELESKASKYMDMSELAAGIAHEVRNPLASVRSAVQEIGKLEHSNPSSSKLAKIVMRESDRLDEIITNFLQFARMKNPSFAPARLETILDEVVLLLENRPEKGGVNILCNYRDKDYRAWADQDQLKQVFLNLGINSLQALGGSGTLTIDVSPGEIPVRMFARIGTGFARKKEAVAVSFSDDGPGIPPEDVPRVFTPFYTNRKGGTGMGLSIVEKIVNDHNGTVDLKSRPGEGATFKVVLPLAPGKETESGEKDE